MEFIPRLVEAEVQDPEALLQVVAISGLVVDRAAIAIAIEVVPVAAAVRALKNSDL